MKKLLIALLMVVAVLPMMAQAFDPVFKEFKNLEGAEYVKVPGLLVRLGASKVEHVDSLPMNLKITGIRVLEVNRQLAPKFEAAIEKASQGCELLLEATDEGEHVSIWVEPNGKKAYNKMIIYAKEDHALVELSGKFSPK